MIPERLTARGNWLLKLKSLKFLPTIFLFSPLNSDVMERDDIFAGNSVCCSIDSRYTRVTCTLCLQSSAVQHYNGTWRKQGRRCWRSRASREPLTWGNVYIQRRRGGASQHLHDTGRECALAQAYLGRVLKQGREHLTLALSRGSYSSLA